VVQGCAMVLRGEQASSAVDPVAVEPGLIETGQFGLPQS